MLGRSLTRCFLLLAAATLGAVGTAGAALADSSPTPEAHTLCIEATRSAERRHHLAPHLLGAISLAETGRWSRDHKASFAWPWTVMAEGRGRYLPSKAAAVAEVRRLQARGVKNIDVGCMQVNLFYHADAFDDLASAFDPETNADYAAAFLRDLKEEVGTWKDAVAYYHSRDDKRGDYYQGKVYDLWYGQRQNLMIAAQGSAPALTAEALAAEAHRAELAQARARKADQYRMIQEARAANVEFLAKQRAMIDARNAAAFEARKAAVLTEWAEMKRRRAEAKAGIRTGDSG
ncbi:murein transglycosylase [Thalassobaculum sp.]|uniref:murein transglycosylase n=1 Tax=Thalassobaculum sp. TaxID=2022740 RepID=UPI0032EF7002